MGEIPAARVLVVMVADEVMTREHRHLDISRPDRIS
jgi:hypothetical protein